MSTLALTRRTVQLDLLAEACRQHVSARVVLPHQPWGTALARTRFLALEGKSLLLSRPESNASDEALQGPVDVYFSLDRERLGFRTTAVEPTVWSNGTRGHQPAWRLKMPLCIESKQQRGHRRVRLDEAAPITVTLTAMNAPAWSCTARLENISRGGLGALLDGTASEMLRVDEVYWARFTLEGLQDCEFVVRLLHARHLKPDDATLLGCMFCPGEDPEYYEAQLQRIEQWVRRGGASPAVGGD